MIKFKAHYKNQNTDKMYDHNFDADSFEQAYGFAQETRRELTELGSPGWRVIGVYEILYNAEKTFIYHPLDIIRSKNGKLPSCFLLSQNQ